MALNKSLTPARVDPNLAQIRFNEAYGRQYSQPSRRSSAQATRVQGPAQKGNRPHQFAAEAFRCADHQIANIASRRPFCRAGQRAVCAATSGRASCSRSAPGDRRASGRLSATTRPRSTLCALAGCSHGQRLGQGPGDCRHGGRPRRRRNDGLLHDAFHPALIKNAL